MRERLRSLLVALTAVGFAVIGSGFLWAGPYTADLNRRPTEWPEFTWDSVWTAEYFSGISNYFKDRVGFRSDLTRLDASLDLAVLTDSPSARVIVGRDGWLFYRPAVDNVSHPGQTTRDLYRQWEPLIEASQRLGFELRLAIAPNKSTIYHDFLPEAEARRNLAGLALMEEVRDRARNQAGDELVDLWTPLLAARERSDAEPLYHPRDTHWNGLGAGIAAEALIDSLRAGLWQREALVEDGEVTRVGELDGISGTGSTITQRIYTVQRPGVQVTTVQQAGNLAVYQASTAEHGPALLPKAVIVHDSFGQIMKQLLPPYFREIVFIDEGSTTKPEAVEAARDAGILIVLKVERNSYGAPWRAPEPYAKPVR